MDILHLTGTFGRLDHSELSLSPGLNVLYAPNETGKSTWGAFIRTMLYGLSTRERGPLADKNRYAPWTGAPMQGRMDLTTHGDACTLLRETRRAASPLGEFSCTYTGTQCYTNEDIRKCSAGTDCRQCRRTNKLTYDNRISHIIYLLKKAA